MQTTNQKFKITVPITRCYRRKNADGVERYVVEGMASNTNFDLTGERMAASAITSMEKSLETHPVLFKNEHGYEWDAEFGQVTALRATPNHELMMEAELDPDHYRTQTLVRALERGKQLGLSIGGYVQEATQEWVESLGRMVKTYTDILLEEISVTGTPAVADTWLTNITKSVQWTEEPMPKPQDQQVTKTEDELQAEAAAEETTATTDEVADDGNQPEGEPPDTPAEDTQSDAAESETTKSQADEGDQPADAQEDTEGQPVEADAAAQEESEADADESAPAQATDDTSGVEKSAVLGDWTEAMLSADAVRELSYRLEEFVWMTMMDDDKSADQKTVAIEAAAGEFQELLMRVVRVLVQDGNAEDVQRAAEAFKATAPDALSKSLTERDANIEELNKALDLKHEELEQATKSLTETEGKLTTAQEELELTRKRKAHVVVGKFDGVQLVEKSTPPISNSPTLNKWLNTN